ncbi:hypothetical protein RCH14_003792 [Massilia sp. MP_M2]|uniref:hypothetical protein n=1 Tax=Massilia sp. MP_M2 TaxID=3071713 RepID=UPI00319E2341
MFAIAKAKDNNMFAYIDALVVHTRLNDKQRRRYLVEELLDHLAEKSPMVKASRCRADERASLLAACQGLLRMAQYNDQDLAYIVPQVRRATTVNVTPSKTGEKRGTAAFRREQSARMVNLHPAIKPKTGLLDTPMRLEFQKAGALTVTLLLSLVMLCNQLVRQLLGPHAGELLERHLRDVLRTPPHLGVQLGRHRQVQPLGAVAQVFPRLRSGCCGLQSGRRKTFIGDGTALSTSPRRAARWRLKCSPVGAYS